MGKLIYLIICFLIALGPFAIPNNYDYLDVYFVYIALLLGLSALGASIYTKFRSTLLLLVFAYSWSFVCTIAFGYISSLVISSSQSFHVVLIQGTYYSLIFTFLSGIVLNDLRISKTGGWKKVFATMQLGLAIIFLTISTLNYYSTVI